MAEDLIAASKEKPKRTQLLLDSIVENIPNMVFVKDAKELRFVLFNKAGEDLLGRGRKDFYGKNDYDFFPKDQADFFTGKDRKVLGSREQLDIPEEPIETPSGKRWLHTKKVPLLDEDGEPEFLLGISEDITDKREIERERDELIAVTSHEIRSPASIVVSLLSILKESLETKLEGDDRENLDLALENAERLLDVLNQSLDIHRLEAKKTEFQMKSLDLEEFLKEAVRLNGPFASRFASKYELLETPKGLRVLADRNQLMQAVTNLMVNAAKFTKKGFPVLVRLLSGDGKARIEIEDRGPGIPEAFYGRIFKKFNRSGSRETSAMEGSGLGLAISKKIVETMGGEIGFRSKPGEGTAFFIDLPLE